MATLDRFMSEWSLLVGDPVLSKWIVVALFVSIILNGYLLKGIASTSAPGGASGPVAVAAAAARLVGAGGAWDSLEPKSETLRSRRRWSGGLHLERMSNGHRVDSLIEADTKLGQDRAKSLDTARPLRRGTIVPQPTIPAHLPHPAPHHKPAVSGDSTPRSEELVNSATVKAPQKEIGHFEVVRTPTVPIFAPQLMSGDDSPVDGQVTHFGRRPLDECWEVYAGGLGALDLSDEEVIMLCEAGKIPAYGLEKGLKDLERAVRVRRAVICECES